MREVTKNCKRCSTPFQRLSTARFTFCSATCHKAARNESFRAHMQTEKHKETWTRWYQINKIKPEVKKRITDYDAIYRNSPAGIRSRKKSRAKKAYKDRQAFLARQRRLDPVLGERIREQKRSSGRASYARRRERMQGNFDVGLTAAEVREVFALFGHACFRCGATERLSIDHVFPVAKGGVLTKDTACILCVPCNASKCDRDPMEFYTVQEMYRLVKILDWEKETGIPLIATYP